MAMGTRRQRQRQEQFWYRRDLAEAPGHPFYRRLNQVLEQAGFDEFCETRCRKFYHEKLGLSSPRNSNQAQDAAGEGAAQAVTAAATEGVVRGVRAIPRNVSTAPVRLTARMAEAAANQKLVPVKPILKIMTPADEAGALHLKVPGRDLGLEPKPVFPGANLPEHPGTFPGAPYPEHPGLFPGANLPETPAPEQLNPSLISKARTLPGQIGKEVIRPKIEPAQPIPPRQGLALPAPRMAGPPPASSLIARPQLHPTVTENPAVGNLARAMQKSGVPMGGATELCAQGQRSDQPDSRTRRGPDRHHVEERQASTTGQGTQDWRTGLGV